MEFLKLKRQLLLFFFSLGINFFLVAQVTSIGEWRSHFAYKQGLALAEGNGKIYCATQGGLFSYNLSDNSFSLMSKINGFSDVAATVINFDPLTNTLVIAYSDANIDIVQNGVVTNLPDIQISSNTGKTINNIFFISPYAYIACSFGIVVVDVNRHETKDTYYIGPGGTSLNVRDVNTDGVSLFAATDEGIYTAPLNSINLADFSNWTLQTRERSKTSPTLPHGAGQVFNTLTYFNSKMYANYSKNLSAGGGWFSDQVYKFDGESWSPSETIKADNFKRLRVNNNFLVAIGEYSVNKFDVNEVRTGSNYNIYGFDNAAAAPADGIVNSDNSAWIADRNYGLVKAFPNSTAETLVPNGPRTKNVFNMAYSKGIIWSVPGGVGLEWVGESYNSDGVSIFQNNSWSTISGVQPGGDMDTLKDLVCIAIDPNNANHAFASSQLNGVLEFNNNSMVKVYNSTNSSLQIQQAVPQTGPNADRQIFAAGIAYDTLGNLWVGNTLTNSLLSVKSANGTWQGIDFTALGANKNTVGSLIVTSLNQKWLNMTRNNSILVYNGVSNKGKYVANSSNTKIINNIAGNGALPGTLVDCMAEDKNGAIWLGTDNGIAVIYNPANIFSGAGSYDAQPIYVQQNGYTQLLFQAELVTAIAVDGANRKWCGTQTSGVFLMSADGTQQIYHFTAQNSPLLSNIISTITINGSTGEVFFGTPNGIVSFKSTATDGGVDFGNVYAYPNPVKHDYTGVIAIKNLATNADVRITDITGTLIYKTIALGGQAIWDGTNFSGERAHTGVYLVFCTSSDGSETRVAKILFIN